MSTLPDFAQEIDSEPGAGMAWNSLVLGVQTRKGTSGSHSVSRITQVEAGDP